MVPGAVDDAKGDGHSSYTIIFYLHGFLLLQLALPPQQQQLANAAQLARSPRSQQQPARPCKLRGCDWPCQPNGHCPAVSRRAQPARRRHVSGKPKASSCGLSAVDVCGSSCRCFRASCLSCFLRCSREGLLRLLSQRHRQGRGGFGGRGLMRGTFSSLLHFQSILKSGE